MIDRNGIRSSRPYSEASLEVDDDALLADAAVPERWRESCELLIHRHRELVQRICTRALDGDRTAAEEASQRTFILLNACAIQLRPPVNLPAWLTRVAINSCHRLRREEERRRRYEQSSGSRQSRCDSGCEQKAVQADGQLAVALAELPAGQRVVIQLHCIEGLPQEEVAGRLGISLSAVRNRLSAARNSLRDMLRRPKAMAGIMALLALLPEARSAESRPSPMRIQRATRRSGPSTSSATWMVPSAMVVSCLLSVLWMARPPVVAPAGDSHVDTQVVDPQPTGHPKFLLDEPTIITSAQPGVIGSVADGDWKITIKSLEGAWATRHRISFRLLRVIPGAQLFRNSSSMRNVTIPGSAPSQSVDSPQAFVEGLHEMCIEIRREEHAIDGIGTLFEIRVTYDGREMKHGWNTGEDPVWHGQFNGSATSIESYTVESLSRADVELPMR